MGHSSSSSLQWHQNLCKVLLLEILYGISGKSGPAVEVPLDGTVYDLQTGKVGLTLEHSYIR